MQALFAQGAVSQQTLDQTKLGFDVAQSNFTAASELVEIRTPVSGEVVRVHVRPGEIVSPGMPVITVAASKEVRVKFSVSSEERQLITPKQTARIHSALSDTLAIPAIVDKVEDAADPVTRLFEVSVKSDNPEGLLKPEVLTSVEIIVEERSDVLSVSNDALLTSRGSEGEIFVVDANNHAARRAVKLGMQTANRAECVAGLTVGDRVVVYGQNRLSDGDPVKIVENVTEKAIRTRNMFLSDLSIRKPILITMIVMSFAVIGLYSFLRLGVDNWPVPQNNFSLSWQF